MLPGFQQASSYSQCFDHSSEKIQVPAKVRKQLVLKFFFLILFSYRLNKHVKVSLPVLFPAVLDMRPFCSEGAQVVKIDLQEVLSVSSVENIVTSLVDDDNVDSGLIYTQLENALIQTTCTEEHWTCPHCTFHNSSIDSKCSICDFPRVSIPLPKSCSSSQYELTAVVRHIGPTPSSGHFVCDSRNFRFGQHDNENAWQRCDDSSVRSITEVDSLFQYFAV